MKIAFDGLAMILNLLLMMVMHQAPGIYSLPSIQQEAGENWKMTTREANSESPANIDAVLEVNQLQSELANLSIPSYLKDLYINLTYPSGVSRPSSNDEETEVNTIQSYKNQAKSKFNVKYI